MAMPPARSACVFALVLTLPIRTAGLASPVAYGAAARRAGRPTPAEGGVLESPAKTSKAFLDVSSQIDAFEHGLAESRESGAAALATLKAEHGEELQVQGSENTRLADSNQKIAASIEGLQGEVAELRHRAGELQSEGGTLRTKIRSIEVNITTGREFAAESLKRFDVSDATEFSVLAELAEEDKAHEQDVAHSKRFHDIQAGLSLLDVSPQEKGADRSHVQPKALLEGLEAGLDQLGKERAATEALLNATFEQDLKAGAARQKVLLADQDRLVATRASLEKLRDRLKAAVAHLEHSTVFLRDRLQSLQAFLARSVGRQVEERHRRPSSAASSAPSLLQLSADVADEDHEEPAFQLSAGPHSALKNFSNTIDLLRSGVESLRAEEEAALSAQRVEYLAQLEAGRTERRNLSEANANLSNDISKLRQSNAQLQETATALALDCDRLEEETRVMQENISMAQEFATHLLENTSAQAPELDVLHELAQKRGQKEFEEAHEQQLRTIGRLAPSVSLLAYASAMEPRRLDNLVAEVGVNASADANASGLVQEMGASLEAVAAEVSERQTLLQRRFQDELQAGALRRAQLEDEQTSLVAARGDLLVLQARLQTAVSSLTQAKWRLVEGVRSLKHFVGKVGKDDEVAPSPKEGRGNRSSREDKRLVIDGKVVPKPASWFSRFTQYVSPSLVPEGPL